MKNPNSGQVLEFIGLSLWGPDWQGEAEHVLKLKDRTIRRARAGEYLPVGVWSELSRLCQQQALALQTGAQLAQQLAIQAAAIDGRPLAAAPASAPVAYWAQVGDDPPEIVEIRNGRVWGMGNNIEMDIEQVRLIQPIAAPKDILPTLGRFQIIEGRTDTDDPEIACYDGGKRILAHVPLEVWEDTGMVPAGPLPNVKELNLLARRYLQLLRTIIERRYIAGDYEMLHRFGSSLPLITIRLAELLPLRDQMARASHSP